MVIVALRLERLQGMQATVQNVLAIGSAKGALNAQCRKVRQSFIVPLAWLSESSGAAAPAANAMAAITRASAIARNEATKSLQVTVESAHPDGGVLVATPYYGAAHKEICFKRAFNAIPSHLCVVLAAPVFIIHMPIVLALLMTRPRIYIVRCAHLHGNASVLCVVAGTTEMHLSAQNPSLGMVIACWFLVALRTSAHGALFNTAPVRLPRAQHMLNGRVQGADAALKVFALAALAGAPICACVLVVLLASRLLVRASPRSPALLPRTHR